MKIHSLNFRTEDKPQNNCLAPSNTLKLNEKNQNDLNINKIISLPKVLQKEKVNKNKDKINFE